MMNAFSLRFRSSVRLLVRLALLAGLLVSPLSFAQPAPIDTPVAFAIPAEDLGDALNGVAIAANLQIFFEAQTVAGRTAPAIEGTLSPRDALSLLLADTSLEFHQNADGTVLVKPRRPRPVGQPTAVAETPAPAVPTAPPSVLTVPATEGPWVLRARGLYVEARNHSDAIAAATTPPVLVPENGERTNDRWVPELDLEYFFAPRWSLELAATAPASQDLDVAATTPAGPLRVGSYQQMLDALTLKYSFFPDSAVRPYLGVGELLSSYTHVTAGPYGLNSTSTGPLAQLGADVRLNDHWFLNADVKWAKARPDLHFEASPVGSLGVDPLLIGVGFGYRFGGTPAHTLIVPAPQPAAAPSPPAVVAAPEPVSKCPGTPASVPVDQEGCPLDSDGDGVPDYLDKCPGTPHGLKVDANGCEIEELVLRGVTFDTNQATLTAQSTDTLDAVVAILRQRPHAKIEVHGYTDARGSDALNNKLSARRAQAVVDYFVRAGIAPELLLARGFGKADPVASNDTAEGRALNRRVTVQFMSPVLR
jgi:OOP family OmpA-OmpF porin